MKDATLAELDYAIEMLKHNISNVIPVQIDGWLSDSLLKLLYGFVLQRGSGHGTDLHVYGLWLVLSGAPLFALCAVRLIKYNGFTFNFYYV